MQTTRVFPVAQPESVAQIMSDNLSPICTFLTSRKDFLHRTTDVVSRLIVLSLMCKIRIQSRSHSLADVVTKTQLVINFANPLENVNNRDLWCAFYSNTLYANLFLIGVVFVRTLLLLWCVACLTIRTRSAMFALPIVQCINANNNKSNNNYDSNGRRTALTKSRVQQRAWPYRANSSASCCATDALSWPTQQPSCSYSPPLAKPFFICANCVSEHWKQLLPSNVMLCLKS